MKNPEKIKRVGEDTADRLVDALIRCTYCKEPFKECDTLIPYIGLITGETSVVKYRGRYWHHGCVEDYRKGSKP